MTTPPLETVSVGTKAPLGRRETSPELTYAALRLRAMADKPITLADGKRFVVVLPEDADTILQALAGMSPRIEQRNE